MSGESFVPVQAFPTLVTPNVANVDVFQMADGTVRQVMVIGDPNIQANVAPVDPTFGLAIDIKRSVSSTVLGGSADNSANLSTKLPVIPARANSSAPSWSEGFQVPLSVDLSGALRVSGASGGGVAQNQVRNSLNAWVDVGFFPGDAPLPVQVQNGLTILSMPSVTVLQGTSPWVTSGGSSGGVTPVLAATVNGLTINGTVTVNQGIPLAPTLANAWPVNVISSVPNLTLTSLPTVTVTGTVNANITASVPNLTLTSIPAVTQGTTPWVVTNLNGNTISALQSGAWSVTALQGTPLAPTVPNAWPVNVVSSVPNLTITSMPAITVSGTITANQGTPTAPTLANAWPVNVVSSVPNLTLTSLPTLTINTPTVNQGTPAAATLANSWPVNVVSSVPNLTLTSLPTVTINTPTVNQGTAGTFGSPWPVTNLQGNTITVLSTVAANLQATANQGTPLAPTVPNAWPVNVVSSVPNLTITSMPNISVNPGTTISVAKANAAAPTYVEGVFNPLSVDLSGALRVSGSSGGGVAQTQVRNSANVWVDVGYQPVPTNLAMPVQVQNGLTILSIPAIQTTAGTTITALQGTPLPATLANAWPVNVVSSVPNLTITSMPAIAVTPGTTITALGAVTLNPPVYGTGTGQPLSLDTAGNLRVSVLATVPNLTITSLPNIAGTVTANQGTPLSPTLANSWPVNVVSSVPNLTLTSLPTITINTPTVNQGTPASFANAWPVVNLNGNTISALQSGTWTVQPGNTPNTTPWLVTTVNGSTVTVVQPLAANLNATVVGNLTNNNAAPIGNNIGVLPAIVNQNAPAWNEGNQSLLSVDRTGSLRVNVVSSVPNLTITSMPTVTVSGTVTANQGTPTAPTLANAWPVNVVSSVPNLTLTSLPIITINTPTVNQGTAGAFTSPWPVTNLQGNTITVLSATAANLQATVNQGTPLAPTLVNAWPVNVVSSVPNLTITSMPNISVNPGTTISVAKATAASPTYVEGVFNPLSVDLTGALRVSGSAGGGVAQTQVRNSANAWIDVGYQPSPTNLFMPVQVMNGLTILSMPSVTVLQGTSPWVTSGGGGGGVTPVIAATSNGLTINGLVTVVGNTITALGSVADNASNPSTKIPTLPARANASAPTWGEGNVVPLSVDTSGALRVSGSAGGGVADLQVRDSAGNWADVGFRPTDKAVPIVSASVAGLTIVGNITNNSGAPGSNNLGVLPAVANANFVSYNEGNEVFLSTNLKGQLRVDATVNSLTITSMPAVSVTPGTTITIWPSTNNGVLTYNSFSVTSTPVQIKTVPGQVYGWSAMNLSGALRVIRVYDKATIPVLSTDIPTLRIPLPPGGVSNMAVSAIGATYNSGIGVAATTALIDFDTSTPGACDVVLSLFYR